MEYLDSLGNAVTIRNGAPMIQLDESYTKRIESIEQRLANLEVQTTTNNRQPQSMDLYSIVFFSILISLLVVWLCHVVVECTEVFSAFVNDRESKVPVTGLLQWLKADDADETCQFLLMSLLFFILVAALWPLAILALVITAAVFSARFVKRFNKTYNKTYSTKRSNGE